MRRQDKYPDTKVFHWYNANPHNKFTGDCVIRAISVAFQQSWEQTYSDLCSIGLKYGLMPNDPKCFERYLKQNGWVKQKQPRKDDNTKYTGKEFCELLQHPEKIYQYMFPISEDNSDRIIANIGGHHIVAIIDGRINDIWNSAGRCIGNYWVKVENH